MKIISKIIIWILSIVALFIIINLIVGACKYKWFSNYVQILDDKNREESANQINIKAPKTRFSIFYADDTWDTISSDDTNTNKKNSLTPKSTNPYEYDYEDEFNSFFAWE